METEEDGMIVVIIEDDDEDATPGNVPVPIQVKTEPSEDTDEVDTLIEMAEKHGEHLNLDIQVKDIKTEALEFEDIEFIEENSEDEEYNPENEDLNYEDGYEVGLNYEDSDYNEESEVEDLNRRQRWKMLRPSECVSYVKELKKQHPELRNDNAALLNHLAQVMKDLKPPIPPRDFYRVNSEDLRFECIKCGVVSNTVPATERHYQDKHGPRYLICYACGVDFRSKTNLYKHEKRCNAPDIGYVLRARALAVGRKGRHRPFLVHTDKPKEKSTQKYNCEECPAVFITKSGLLSHQNLHRGERPFKCGDCGSAYTSSSALARHKYKHGDQKFVCDHCQREFNMKHALVSHLDTHLPEKKFLCPYDNCGRRFAHKMHLNIHIDSRHMNLPPPCACQICPRRFARMSLLKVHMKKVHGMILMTRRMFFKSLPKLTETQVQQAKIFLKSEPIHQIGESTGYELREDTGEFRSGTGDLQEETGEIREDTREFREDTEEFRENCGEYLEEHSDIAEECADEEKEMEPADVTEYLEILLRDKCRKLDKDAKQVVIDKGEMIDVNSKLMRRKFKKLIRDVKEEIVNSSESMPEI